MLLLPCPSTRWQKWDSKIQRVERSFLQRIERPPDVEDEAAWLRDNASGLIRPALLAAGALHLSGFALPQSMVGFRRFCELLSFQPCTDPLSKIGIRSLLSEADGVYEAVDAPSLASTFIGLHNDVTFTRGAPYAAFGCFQRATGGGGAFLLCDGRRILEELDPAILQRLCERQLRVRVAEPPLSLSWAPASARPALGAAALHFVRPLLNAAIPSLSLDIDWSDDFSRLQIFEPSKPPVNCHWRGEGGASRAAWPSFFSGVHSQSQYLQRRRAGSAFAGGLGASDVFYGDGSPLEASTLDHIDEVLSRLTMRVPMEEGDVVLLDSYQALHGRDAFEGEREHAVLWLTTEEFAGGDSEGGDSERGGDDAGLTSASAAGALSGSLSGVVNRLAVKR